MADIKFSNIHCPQDGSGDIVTDEMINKEDQAELNIYGKSAEEAKEEENLVKEIQTDAAREEGFAEAAASQGLGPEITGAKTQVSPDSSSQEPTNVLDREAKAEESMNYVQPTLSEIEEETELAKEIKGKNQKK